MLVLASTESPERSTMIFGVNVPLLAYCTIQ